MSVLVCPVCQGSMREVSHEGVLIDTCTQCRGVWLDRGELEKLSGLIDNSGRPPPGRLMGGASMDRRYRDDDDDDYRGRQGDYHRKSKVSRFLDFFD